MIRAGAPGLIGGGSCDHRSALTGGPLPRRACRCPGPFGVAGYGVSHQVLQVLCLPLITSLIRHQIRSAGGCQLDPYTYRTYHVWWLAAMEPSFPVSCPSPATLGRHEGQKRSGEQKTEPAGPSETTPLGLRMSSEPGHGAGRGLGGPANAAMGGATRGTFLCHATVQNLHSIARGRGRRWRV